MRPEGGLDFSTYKSEVVIPGSAAKLSDVARITQACKQEEPSRASVDINSMLEDDSELFGPLPNFDDMSI